MSQPLDPVPSAPILAQSLAEEVRELADAYRGTGVDFVLVCLTRPDGPGGSQVLAETVGMARALDWLRQTVAEIARATAEESGTDDA